MKTIVFSGVFFLFCLIGVLGVESVICRSCNLSMPFHGCLVDFGTCRTKPGQFCFQEVHINGGIKWFSVKGCTDTRGDCFKRTVRYYQTWSIHCCYHPLCNF